MIVKLYSTDGESSPIIDYIKEMSDKNPSLAKQAIKDIYTLPNHLYLNTNVKAFRVGKIRFQELRVRNKNNICRFFFEIDSPNVVVIYGFTKTTQKTEKKDIKLGIENLKDYRENRITISLEEIGDLL
ncbi:MAG: type II toxin-antitoxin system RelE/ParE family toxin [bacterium]